jgi:inner membrane protein
VAPNCRTRALDNITHTLTGLALSRAGLNRLTPGATAILLLSSNAPDLDVVSAAWGQLTYLNYHRHITHSILAIPVMALLPVLLVKALSRKPVAWKPALLLSTAGVAAHLLFDLTNVYGIRLLLPFSARWFRWDLLFIADPYILAALVLALAGSALSRLIGSEIGERRKPGRLAAALVLAFIALYTSARAVIHERAISTLDSRVYSSAPPRAVAAFPAQFNPFFWRGVVDSSGAYRLFALDVRREFDPTVNRLVRPPADETAVRIARETPVFRDFLAFSQFPAWSVTPLSDPPGGVRVEAFDLRFSESPGRGFTATAILDASGAVVRTSFEFL